MKEIIIAILIFFSLSILHAEGPPSAPLETAPVQLRYFKMGTEMGFGYRRHAKHGVDISENMTSIVVDNWFSLKALYLQYPWYAQHRLFYWGAGAGVVYEVALFEESLYPSLESLVGYEFFTDKKIKVFVQLGASVPIGCDTGWPVLPLFSVGAGF
jgi:hypothetical protein